MKFSPRTTKLMLLGGILFLVMLLSSLAHRNTYFEGLDNHDCKDETPNWNSETKKCVAKCETDKKWNSKTNLCA